MRALGEVAVALAITACAGAQSALDVRGPGAERIAALWWLLLGVAAVVYAIVMVLFLGAVLRSRRDGREGDEETDHVRRGQARRLIGGTIALTAIILTAVFIVTLRTQAALHAHTAEDLTIKVIGRQWWWEIRYHGPSADSVITANEIHIPTGERVRIELTSADVIHSLWVPNLQGKTDLVPGRTLVTWLQADVPGISRGQCAEYCGIQHTNMALLVVAETPADFARWLAEQRQPAPAPADAISQQGQSIFEGSGCAYCHTVSGTRAAGSLGPDLTHFASRRTIAAGTLTNTRENLAAWLADPQRIKPGNLMPRVTLTPAALDAVVHYLESLR